MKLIDKTALAVLESLDADIDKTARELSAQIFYGKRKIKPCTLDYRIRAAVKHLLSLQWGVEGESSTLWRLNCYHFKLARLMFADGPVRDAVRKLDRTPSPGEVMTVLDGVGGPMKVS